MSIKRKPSWLERKLILTPIRSFLTKKFNIEIERNDTVQLKPPYMILSNHTNNWDPLLINCFVEEPICFVAAEPLFHHPLLKKVLDYAGAIPKTKSRADTSTIRNMVLAKKHNRVIGMFPEGNRCWDGHTEEIVYATAKLVKMLQIPVVIGTIKGGYLTHPRWAASDRKGKIAISLQKKWDQADIKELTVDEIHQELSSAIYFDELMWQKQEQISFKGPKLANYLERVLYVCPSCQSIATMHSVDNQFSCTSCDYSVIYNEYGHFEASRQPLHFTYIHEWNAWQKQHTAEKLFRSKDIAGWKRALRSEVTFYAAEASQPFRLIDKGILTWYVDHIVFTPHNNKEAMTMPIDKIEDANIHMNNKLDFYFNDISGRFTFDNPRQSPVMWYEVIKLSATKGGA